MKRHEQFLLENKAWAREMVEADPEFFNRMSKEQKPEFLWIGCSDSRVSPDEIAKVQMGEVFIHRNIANLMVPTDINLLSVVQYAVEVLKIKHIIICGHYGCGGIAAALSDASFGIIDEWLHGVKDVYQRHREDIDNQPNEEERVNRLVEYNVREQLLNLARTDIIRKAWNEHRKPFLHGWVYDMRDGIIKPMLELDPQISLEEHERQLQGVRLVV